MRKYKYQFGNIVGVIGEKAIFDKDIGDIQVLVTRQPTDKYKENYFNVYFIDPKFKTDPMNNFHEQIPVENKPKNWEEYLKIEYISYYAWREFNLEGYFTKDN